MQVFSLFRFRIFNKSKYINKKRKTICSKWYKDKFIRTNYQKKVRTISGQFCSTCNKILFFIQKYATNVVNRGTFQWSSFICITGYVLFYSHSCFGRITKVFFNEKIMGFNPWKLSFGSWFRNVSHFNKCIQKTIELLFLMFTLKQSGS